jgi:4Fe-4S single cluster domain
MRLKGFERIDLQNLIRQMPGYKEGSELQAEIRSSARSPSRCRGHGMCTTLCPEVFAINDDGYAEVQLPEVPDGQEDAARRH